MQNWLKFTITIVISEESTNSKQKKKKSVGGINQWIESREVSKDFTEMTFELSFENVLMQLKTMCITSWGKRVSKSLMLSNWIIDCLIVYLGIRMAKMWDEKWYNKKINW